MSLEGLRVDELARVYRAGPPYPDRTVYRAGDDELRACFRTYVESNRADFVGMPDEERIDPALRIFLYVHCSQHSVQHRSPC